MTTKPPTITALDFARLDEARRLQVERYRTAYFKREGALPSDSDPAIDRAFLRVALGPLDCLIPVAMLTAWGKTFGEAAPLSFDLSPGSLTVSRGTSRLRVFASRVEYDDKGNGYRTTDTRKAETLPAPVVLTVTPGNAITLCVPDLAEELKTLRAETTANRKAVNREKAIAKAKRAEREAVDDLARDSDEAAKAQAVLDSMTLRQAISAAKRCRAAMRDYRAALAEPFTAPAWLPPSFTVSRYEWCEQAQDHVDKVSTVDTLTAWGEHVATYRAALDALAAYKPRLSWPSYVESLAKEAGQSLAAYKRANPNRAFPIRGPQFDKLTDAKRQAFRALDSFVSCRCSEYLREQGHGEYRRARRLLSTWDQRRADLESRVFEARKGRERAEA